MFAQETKSVEVPKEVLQEQTVMVVYTNWRGETAERKICPISMRFGSTEWHKKEQWLLKVWDYDRQAYREYALADIKEWR